MPYQPTFPYPYMDTIDVEKEEGNIFKCLINSKDTVLGATINIYSNLNNSLVKTIKHSEDTFPFAGGLGDNSWLQCNIDSSGLHNGMDYKWSMDLIFDTYKAIYLGHIERADRTFIDIPRDNSVFNQIVDMNKNDKDCYLVVNSEKVKISSAGNTSFNGVDLTRLTLVDSLTTIPQKGDWCEVYTDITYLTTPEYYFKARTSPEVIFDVPNKISNSVYTFEANYSQKQKIGIVYFQYDLYSNGALIASSGQVFSQKISYTFESFVSGTPYSIKLTIVNNDGIEIETERKFTVEYEVFASIISPVISVNNFKACANVDFSNNASIPSTLIGSSDINYKVFDKPDYKIISNGRLVSYVSPTTLIIQPYDNILIGMYLKIGEELKKIIKIESNATDNIVVSIEESFITNLSSGDEYEICSYFNGINLNEQQTILWDNIGGNLLDIPEKSTQVVHWHASHGFSGLILEKVDFNNPKKSTYVSYNGGMFTYEIGLKKGVYNPYIGTASAIAGKDEHSVKGTIIEYFSNSIVLENSSLISVGKIIQIGTESRVIKSVTVNQNNTTVVLNRAFTSASLDSTNSYVVYDENYLYTLSNDDELQDTDILIDSDLAYNYWWLIVLLPDEVQFIKTTSFTESEV